MRASVGDPPWMAIAREQKARGIKEDPGDRNTAGDRRLLRGHQRRRRHRRRPNRPWCGAFVGSCIKTCGLPGAAGQGHSGGGRRGFLARRRGPGAEPTSGWIDRCLPGRHVGFLAEGRLAAEAADPGRQPKRRVCYRAASTGLGAQFRWFGGAPGLRLRPVPPRRAASSRWRREIMEKLLRPILRS